jgi:predicted porin
MKKSLLAMAALTAFAGVASAQSSVTIGGKMDLGIGKSIGTANKGIQDAAGSRLNFGGVEDLGGGLRAVFGMEHRLNPDDGTTNSGNFWNGYSWVGLSGAFGTIRLGRDYTSSFIVVQNQIDPQGGDTVTALRGNSVQIAPAKVRFANGIKYIYSDSGLTVSYDISEGSLNNAGGTDLTVVNRPWSVAVSYGAGPLWAGFSHENPGGKFDKLSTFGGRYAFGPVTLRAGASTGTNNSNLKVKGLLLGANYTMGAGDFRVGYATNSVNGVKAAKRLGFGYHHALSKRTKLYVDFARDSVPVTQKSGYDFGIQHNF